MSSNIQQARCWRCGTCNWESRTPVQRVGTKYRYRETIRLVTKNHKSYKLRKFGLLSLVRRIENFQLRNYFLPVKYCRNQNNQKLEQQCATKCWNSFVMQSGKITESEIIQLEESIFTALIPKLSQAKMMFACIYRHLFKTSLPICNAFAEVKWQRRF